MAWNGKQHHGTGGQTRESSTTGQNTGLPRAQGRVSRRPLECRGIRLRLGGHFGTRRSWANCRANGHGAQPGGDLLYQPSAKKENEEK